MKKISLFVLAMALSVTTVTGMAQTSSAYSKDWYNEKAKELCGKGFSKKPLEKRNDIGNGKSGKIWAKTAVLVNTKTKEVCSVGFGGKWNEDNKYLRNSTWISYKYAYEEVDRDSQSGDFSQYAGPLKLSYAGHNLDDLMIGSTAQVEVQRDSKYQYGFDTQSYEKR